MTDLTPIKTVLVDALTHVAAIEHDWCGISTQEIAEEAAAACKSVEEIAEWITTRGVGRR